MKTKTINQEILIKNAEPHQIYEIIMDSVKHADLISSTAEISREIEGKFSVYDGYITGKNIELVPDKKIVQQCRFKKSDNNWPAPKPK